MLEHPCRLMYTSFLCAQAITSKNDMDEENRRVKSGDIPKAVSDLFDLSLRHYMSQCLYTFVKIGAANAIAGDQLTPAAIAAKLDM